MGDYRVFIGEYEVTPLVESITVEDSLSELAVRVSLEMMHSPELPPLALGMPARISGTPPDATSPIYLVGSSAHPAVLWEAGSTTIGPSVKALPLTLYDRLIYLMKSEEEYLHPANTATERLKRYARDWGLPLGTLADTGQSLKMLVYRGQSLAEMIRNDLRETAQKSGRMYAVQMTPNGISLYQIGAGTAAWSLDGIVEAGAEQKRTLEGTVTKVKVYGQGSDNARAPLLATLTGDTAKYGTLQQVIRKGKNDQLSTVTAEGRELLGGPDETIILPCAVSIPTLRAGDLVSYSGHTWVACKVRHEWKPADAMNVTLGGMAYVRRTYYRR